MSSSIMFDRKWKIVLTAGSKSKTLRELKVTFNITNTLLGDASLATFQIFNINTETEAILSDNTCVLEFYAGYYSDDENTWNVLFKGEVTNCYEIRQQTERVWQVWARDSFSLLTYTNVTIPSIVNPIPVKTILEKLIASAPGLKGKPLYIDNSDKKLLALEDEDDYSPTGNYTQEFNDLLLKHGIGWQVQQDEIIIFDQKETDPSSLEGDAITISRETGLLSVPMVDYTGVNFTHLLNGKLRPSKIIDVAPNTARYKLGNEFYVERYDIKQWRANGRFRVFETTHRGDTRGDKWETEVIAFYRRN